MDVGQERDERLMVLVAEGRADLIAPLVRRYGTLLLTFIRHMVGDHHRSEELFQEVFLAVWSKRDQYRFPKPFKPWLYKIAINRCRQDFRVHGLGRVGSLDSEHAPPVLSRDPSPENAAIATETGLLVERAVSLLPPRQRLVIVMKLWNGLSYAQIAEAMGVRQVTVRSNMHDALAAVRRFLEPRL